MLFFLLLLGSCISLRTSIYQVSQQAKRKLLLNLGASGVDESTKASATAPLNIVLFGASGRTGALVSQKLYDNQLGTVKCVARNIRKLKSVLGTKISESVEIIPLDLTVAKYEELVSVVKGAHVVISCMSYLPSGGLPDPLGPYKVDNVVTKLLIDACVDCRVQKFVLVSSLLTNGIFSGQVLNPQFILLNLFGGVLYQKRQAELYLINQDGLRYTIIRPGGLRSEAPRHPILYASADTLFRGSISRSQVADVVVAAAHLSESDNKILEIISSQDAKEVPISVGFDSVESMNAKKLAAF